jgi:hypothetical protein
MKWRVVSVLVLASCAASAQSDKDQCPKGCLDELNPIKSDIHNIKTTSPKLQFINTVAVPQKGGTREVPAEVDLKPFWENILLIQISVGQNAMYVPFIGDMQTTPANSLPTSFRLPVPCLQNPGLVQSGALTVSVSQRKLIAIASGCPMDMNVEVTLLLKM